MSAHVVGLTAIASAIAEGRAMVATASEAGAHGQWGEAAALLEAWAERLEAAVGSLTDAELASLDKETIAIIARTVASAGRMHAFVSDAAAYAWNRAAAGGARA